MTTTTERRAPQFSLPGYVIAMLISIAFLATCLLKLAGVVTWAWPLILAPIWLPFAVGYVYCICALLLAVRK